MANLDKIFKAYDIRGVYPEELDEILAYYIGRAIALELKPEKILIGRDVRQMAPQIQTAIVRGIADFGVKISDMGLITTDMLYFASGYFNLPGLSVTASHNPAEYIGIKLVRAGAEAVSSETGLLEIKELAKKEVSGAQKPSESPAPAVEKIDVLEPYLKHILSFVQADKLKPIKIVAGANFGAASIVLKKLARLLPLEITPLDFEIDGTFPKGPPNPLLAERRTETEELIKKSAVDFGVAWDGDADRCFFWDGAGNFINPYYIGILLAKTLMEKSVGDKEKFIRSSSLGWLFDKVVSENGGIPLQTRVGHSFIKARMRSENAVFAAEPSGHYYFRKNYYADNGLIPFLLVWQILSSTGKNLHELIADYQTAMSVSDEINFSVNDASAVMNKIASAYAGIGKIEQNESGLTIETGEARINVRPSNTEPLLRLNVEAVDDKTIDRVVRQITDLINRNTIAS